MSAAQVLTKVRKISLEVVSGPLKGGVYHFVKPLILIGRGLENDLVIENDSKISRMHVEIRQNSGMITIHNVSERNTLLLNGQLVKSAALEGSMRFLIGETEFFARVEAPTDAGSVPRPQSGNPPKLRAVPKENNFAPFSGMPPSPGATQKAGPSGPQRPGPAAGVRQNPAPPVAGSSRNSKLLFYVIIGIVILVGGHFASDSISKHRKAQTIKTTEEVDTNVKLANDTVEEITKKLEEKGVDSRSYQTAQQQYVRGFRDYNQGQYARAIRELGAAITYYPQHELAKRYLAMAEKKQDEIIREEMDLGQKYRGQSSYRMCVASFKKVIMLIDDPEDKVSKEAEQLMSECELQQREHY